MAIDLTVQDGDGTINLTVDSGVDSRTDISDSGSTVVSDTTDINFATNLSVVDDGDGSVSVDASGAALTTQDDGTNVETATDTLDFQTDFNVTNPTTGEAEIALDNNDVTVAGNTVSLGGSTTVDYVDLNDTGSSFPIPNSDLANSSVTFAGNTASLGGSATVDYIDLNDTGSNFPIPNTDLANSSVTVAGNSVSLGGSTSVSATDLSDIATSSETAGQLLLYHASNGQYQNANLSAGNALSATTGDASITVDVDTDGIQADEIDQSSSLQWTTQQRFDAGIDTRGDIVDNTTTIWSSTNGWVPLSSLEADSITLNGGDGLKNGSTASLGGSFSLDIEPADFAGTLLSDDGSDNLQVNESNISHDGIDQTTVNEDDHHVRGGFSRVDVTTTSVTASRWESLWIDTGTAGGNVTVALPADSNTADGERVEVGVEDATNDTDVSPNTGQTIIGNNPTLTQVGDTLTFEFKSSTSTWMVR